MIPFVAIASSALAILSEDDGIDLDDAFARSVLLGDANSLFLAASDAGAVVEVEEHLAGAALASRSLGELEQILKVYFSYCQLAAFLPPPPEPFEIHSDRAFSRLVPAGMPAEYPVPKLPTFGTGARDLVFSVSMRPRDGSIGQTKAFAQERGVTYQIQGQCPASGLIDLERVPVPTTDPFWVRSYLDDESLYIDPGTDPLGKRNGSIVLSWDDDEFIALASDGTTVFRKTFPSHGIRSNLPKLITKSSFFGSGSNGERWYLETAKPTVFFLHRTGSWPYSFASGSRSGSERPMTFSLGFGRSQSIGGSTLASAMVDAWAFNRVAFLLDHTKHFSDAGKLVAGPHPALVAAYERGHLLAGTRDAMRTVLERKSAPAGRKKK